MPNWSSGRELNRLRRRGTLLDVTNIDSDSGITTRPDCNAEYSSTICT